MKNKFPVILPVLLLAIACVIPARAQTVSGADDGTVLKQIIIFGRHSIRSSTFDTNTLNALAADPFPVFEVGVGHLTPRGQQAATLMGAYFRDYLLHEGLLTGDTQTDLARSYFRANSIQRSFMTAEKIGEGLLPGATIPVHSFAIANAALNITNVPDPVIDPVAANVVTNGSEFRSHGLAGHTRIGRNGLVEERRELARRQRRLGSMHFAEWLSQSTHLAGNSARQFEH